MTATRGQRARACAGALRARACAAWTCVCTWVCTCACAAAPAPLQLIEQAQFQPAGASGWQTVRLPHEWPAPAAGRPERRATYLLRFDVEGDASAPGRLWALSVRRLSTRHRISVNGALIAASEAGRADQLPQHVHPVFVEIPPALLHAGRNELMLEIEAEQGQGEGRGLAPLRVGLRDEVLFDDERFEALHVTLPQSINAATLPFALALLVLWAVRRRESAAALFALAWLPTALRNHGVYIAAAPLGSDFVRSSVVLGRVGAAIVLTLFAISVSREHWPRLRRFCHLSLLLLAGVLALALASGRLAAWRLALYPLALPYLALAVGVLWGRVRRERPQLVALLGAVGGALLAAGIHDELNVLGRLGVEAEEWLPWVSPLVFVGVSIWLLTRAARALDEVEALNLRLEQRVAERTTELRAANAAKSRFLAAASHDLRQPLHAISLLTALLSRRAAAPEIATVVERLDESVTGMQAMLDALLDVTSLDAGTERPRLEPLAVADVFARVAHDQWAQAAERGLALRVRPTRLWVRSDAAMLGRIVQNLVANALRYTASGGVLVAARSRGEQVLIEVWDTGIGIAPGQQEAIFGEFVQLANPARDRRRGVGLGLAIVRRMAGLLGTQVSLASRPGRGSVFRLRLPRVAIDLAPRRSGAASSNDAAALDDASGLFVLVIDDDEAIRFSMTALLTELGCRVVTAASSRDALAELARHLRAPDAAIVDYRLGVETGSSAIAALRANVDVSLPVALVSGDIAMPRPLAGGPAVVVMRKPLAARELCAWLAQVKRAAGGSTVVDAAPTLTPPPAQSLRGHPMHPPRPCG